MTFRSAAAPAGVAALCLAWAGSAAYVDGPPAGHTGGFGEPTCAACHFDHEINEPQGRLTLSGLPVTYEPAASYQIEIALARVKMASAGFQLSARFADGPSGGEQAGTLRPLDDRAELAHDSDSPIAYLQHAETGTDVADASVSWTFEWQAPSDPGGDVVFDVAANAANDDLSAFGDWIYTASEIVPAPAP